MYHSLSLSLSHSLSLSLSLSLTLLILKSLFPLWTTSLSKHMYTYERIKIRVDVDLKNAFYQAMDIHTFCKPTSPLHPTTHTPARVQTNTHINTNKANKWDVYANTLTPPKRQWFTSTPSWPELLHLDSCLLRKMELYKVPVCIYVGTYISLLTRVA